MGLFLASRSDLIVAGPDPVVSSPNGKLVIYDVLRFPTCPCRREDNGLHGGAHSWEGKRPRCNGCKEASIGCRYRCELCDFYLHKCSAVPSQSISHSFYPKCNFQFFSRPPGNSMHYCNAYGKDVLGFVYHCRLCGFDLHPCCYNLPHMLDDSDVKLHLHKVSSACHWRGRKGPRWSYWSACKKYHLHPASPSALANMIYNKEIIHSSHPQHRAQVRVQGGALQVRWLQGGWHWMQAGAEGGGGRSGHGPVVQHGPPHNKILAPPLDAGTGAIYVALTSTSAARSPASPFPIPSTPNATSSSSPGCPATACTTTMTLACRGGAKIFFRGGPTVLLNSNAPPPSAPGGKDVLGFVYHCRPCRFDLHPCCYNLPHMLDDGDVKLYLHKKVSSPCHRCGRKGPSWSYQSAYKKYHMHVSGVKEMLADNWQDLYDSDRKTSLKLYTGIPSLKGKPQNHHRSRWGKVRKFCEMGGLAVQFKGSDRVAGVIGFLMSK
ncbi:hypothetical protein EJ110_NYTH55901 [Nymphaea thermarum]|nr:hypothetical protein EJ110_NYTH55901 [Nymphaea thermarum]